MQVNYFGDVHGLSPEEKQGVIVPYPISFTQWVEKDDMLEFWEKLTPAEGWNRISVIFVLIPGMRSTAVRDRPTGPIVPVPVGIGDVPVEVWGIDSSASGAALQTEALLSEFGWSADEFRYLRVIAFAFAARIAM